MLNALPTEILLEILKYLSLIEILKIQMVSRKFRSLVKDNPLFILRHSFVSDENWWKDKLKDPSNDYKEIYSKNNKSSKKLAVKLHLKQSSWLQNIYFRVERKYRFNQSISKEFQIFIFAIKNGYDVIVKNYIEKNKLILKNLENKIFGVMSTKIFYTAIFNWEDKNFSRIIRAALISNNITCFKLVSDFINDNFLYFDSNLSEFGHRKIPLIYFHKTVTLCEIIINEYEKNTVYMPILHILLTDCKISIDNIYDQQKKEVKKIIFKHILPKFNIQTIQLFLEKNIVGVDEPDCNFLAHAIKIKDTAAIKFLLAAKAKVVKKTPIQLAYEIDDEVVMLFDEQEIKEFRQLDTKIKFWQGKIPEETNQVPMEESAIENSLQISHS